MIVKVNSTSCSDFEGDVVVVAVKVNLLLLWLQRLSCCGEGELVIVVVKVNFLWLSLVKPVNWLVNILLLSWR